MARAPHKVCVDCGRDLPLDQFPPHKGYGKDEREVRCRPCHNAYKRAKSQGRETKFPDPKKYHELDPRHQAMTVQTADAFEAFFNEFAHEQGQLPAHGKKWVAAALSHPFLLLNVPPRHAKTTIMAMWFSIWQLACNRDTQIIVVSKTIKGGQKISRKISYELEYNRALNEAFGRFRPLDYTRKWSDTAGELEIDGKNLALRSGDLSLQIRGAGQQILGMEADWIIADDITDRRVALSETKREDEWEYFHGDMMTRLSPEGKAFCIGQRVHQDDIYGRLAKAVDEEGVRVWHLERSAAVLDWTDQTVLWPEIWSFEKMTAKRKSIGSALFSCMYQQEPEVAGDFVPRWWIVGNGEAETPGCLDADRTLGQGWRPENPMDGFLPVTRVVAIDPSPTQYCGIVVADVIFQHRATEFWCNIVDVVRDKMGLRSMLEVIETVADIHRPSVCIFESNSVKWLKEDVAWNRIASRFRATIEHNTTAVNKRDGLMGVWSLASDFEAGRIRFPWADADSREASNYLINEVLAYPNGSTDDTLMALWFIKFNYKKLLPRDYLPTTFAIPVPGTRKRTPGSWDMTRLKNNEWSLSGRV